MPPASSSRMPPLASDRPGSSAAGSGCTTVRRNAHVTESRVVLYRWHPWYDREVFVLRSVRKGEQVVLRCALELAEVAPRLDVPQWMFDAAICCGMRLMTQASVSVEVLRDIETLLRAVIAAGSPVLKAEHLSQPGEGAHAPSQGATPARPNDAVPTTADNSAMGESSDRNSRTHAAVTRAVSPAPSLRPTRRSGGAR